MCTHVAFNLPHVFKLKTRGGRVQRLQAAPNVKSYRTLFMITYSSCGGSKAHHPQSKTIPPIIHTLWFINNVSKHHKGSKPHGAVYGYHRLCASHYRHYRPLDCYCNMWCLQTRPPITPKSHCVSLKGTGEKLCKLLLLFRLGPSSL